MSLEIKVEPEAVQSLTERARLVSSDRIDNALGKLEELESTISSWQGDSKSAYDSLHTEMKDTLTNTRDLMNAMLLALDKSMEDFSKMDSEISARFKRVVENYIGD